MTGEQRKKGAKKYSAKLSLVRQWRSADSGVIFFFAISWKRIDIRPIMAEIECRALPLRILQDRDLV